MDLIGRLPKGFDTEVGERGLKLSGGEKQRVAIARTLVKNPPILLLDEATSALDTRTEQDILATLHRVSTGRTSLSIAHRLSTIADADQILVLNDGMLAEHGTHGELLRRDGLYAEMWARQASEVEEESAEAAE
jgi:ATP-binding cassette subfamily B protein